MKAKITLTRNAEQGWLRPVLFSWLILVAPVALGLLGDVNQDALINDNDADLVLDALVGTTTLTTQQQADADVDDTGTVSAADAQLIKQFAGGQITGFPPRLSYASSPVSLSRDGSLVAVVNPDNDSVSIVETATDSLVAEVAVGREPAGVVFSRNGAKAYVTNSRDRSVSVIDVASLSVMSTLAVGVEPFGVVINNRGDLAYVSNMMSATVSVIDVATDTVVGETPVAAKPQGLAVSADSSTVYVTHLNGGVVSAVDAATLGVTPIPISETPFNPSSTTTPAGVANRMKGLAIHPGNGQVWLPHQLANSGNFVETLFDTSIFPAVSIVDGTSNTELPGNRITLFAGLLTVVGSPEAVAFAPDGSLAYVVSAASNDLTVLDTTTRQEVSILRDVGDNPRGIAVTADGTKAYIFNRLSPVLSVIDLVTETIAASIATAPGLLPPAVDNGRRLLFTSALPEVARDRFFGCEACHFDGRDDGQTWFFTNGPRQTLGMAGDTTRSGLMHHNGDRIDLQDFAATFTRLQGGTGLTQDQLDDLATFSNFNIRFFDNPNLNADGSMTTDARAGRRLFKQLNCDSCHSGPFLTDADGQNDISNPLLHDVGIFAAGTQSQDATDKTRDQAGTAGGTLRPAGSFETTMLLGAFATPPYLHDGRAVTLRDTLTAVGNPGDQHGVTSTLSSTELDQLVAYLLQVDIVNARVKITFPADDARLVGLSTVSGSVLPEVQTVDVFVNGAGPISAVVSNGTFTAAVPPAMVPGLAAGQRFDISARATASGGDLGRDDIEVEANFGASADISTSTVSANPALLTADGSDTTLVTVTPADSAGDAIGSGVLLDVQSTLGSMGPVQDLGDGRYQAVLTAAISAGNAIVSANEQGGGSFAATTVVRFAAGDVDAAVSSIAVDSTSLEANGFAPATVTITPRDAFGNGLGSGQMVDLGADLGATGAVVDQGDGTYTATYTAALTTGLATLTATVNGVALDTTPGINLVADVTAPDTANLDAITFGAPVSGLSLVTGGAGSVEPLATVRLENLDTMQVVLVSANSDGSFSGSLLVGSNETVAVRVDDVAGNVGTAVNTVPFASLVVAVRGVVQVAQSGGGFSPVAGAAVELDIADLSDPLNPGFSPVFAGGNYLTAVSQADGSFEIVLPSGFVPDPDLAVVTGPDGNGDGLVEAIDNFAMVNVVNRSVLVDEVATTQVFLIGFNDSLLGNSPPPFPSSHFTADERAAIEDSIRAATAGTDFFNNDPLQAIADDVFFDVDGPKDALDTLAYATFQTAAESPGEGGTPVVIQGRLTVPSATGEVPLANVTVALSTLSFLNPPACTTQICVAPIAGADTLTDANGDYSLTVPSFVVPGSTSVVVAVGDLTYNGAGQPGPFNETISVFSLGGFFTHVGEAVDADLAGRLAMNLIQAQDAPIENFNPDEMRDLLALLRTRLPLAAVPLANKTLQQVFVDAFNAMMADTTVTSFLADISDPEPRSDTSVVTASPTSLEGDGVSVSTINIEPRNEVSALVGPGKVINVTSTLGVVTTPAIDNGDGTYTAFLRAPTAAGVATVKATMEGTTFDQQPQITFTADITAPVAPDPGKIVFVNVGTTATVIGLPGAVEAFSRLTITNNTQGVSVTVNVSADGSFRADITGSVGNSLTLSSQDAADNTSANTNTAVASGLALPAIANPAAVPGGFTLAPFSAAQLETGVPAGYTFLRGFKLDLLGQTASAPLEVVMNSAMAVPPGAAIALVEVIEVQEAPALRVVGKALSAGGVLFPVAGSSFPGVTESGRYAFLAAPAPLAYVFGTASGDRGAISGALVSLDASPFVDLTRTDGRYLTAGAVGSAAQTGVQLFAHQAATNLGVQLPFAGSETQRDFILTTRVDTVHAFTGRFAATGEVARRVLVQPSGDQFYQMLNNLGDLAVFDAGTLQQVSLVADAQSLEDLAFTPNGFEVFIAYFNQVRDLTVSIEELGLQIKTVGFPRVIAIVPSGELALVASSLDDSSADSDPDALYVIDTFSNKVEAVSLPLPADPAAIAINRAGTRAYVASRTQATLSVIDIPNRAVLDQVTLGTTLIDVQVSSDGNELYLADLDAHVVHILDAALAEDGLPGNEVLATVAVGTNPGALALTPDNNRLLVSERADDTVSVIDLVTRTVSQVWATVDVPYDVAIHGDGTRAYVLDPTTLRGVLEVPLAAADTHPPTVIDTGPRDRAQLLLQDSPLEIVFSEKMNAATFDFTNIQVLDATASPVPGTLSSVGNGVTALFTPDPGVRYTLNSQLTVNLGTGLTDAAGNALSASVLEMVPTQVMQLVNLTLITVDITTAGIIATGQPGAVEPNSKVLITNLASNQMFQGDAGADGSFQVTLTGLDTDGYEIVSQLFGGRAATDALPLPVNFTIVIPVPGLISYQASIGGTLLATGAAGAVDSKSSLIEVRNLTSNTSFETTSVNPDGSFSIPVFAQQGDSLELVSTLLGAVILDPVPLAVPAFTPPVITELTPSGFPIEQATSVTVLGTDFGVNATDILLTVDDVARTDFTLGVDPISGQQSISVLVPAGSNAGKITVTYAGQTSNDMTYAPIDPVGGDPFPESIVDSTASGDPNLILGRRNSTYVDLGAGGVITVRLGMIPLDGSGDDLRIYENDADGEDCYEVQVSPSSAGPFESLGQLCGIDTIDLGGRRNMLYVRIIDANDGGAAAQIDTIQIIRPKMTLDLQEGAGAAAAQSSSSAVSSFQGSTVIPLAAAAAGSSLELCQKEEKDLYLSVWPPENPQAYYGPACEDTVDWSVQPSRAGTIQPDGTNKYKAKLTAGMLQEGEDQMMGTVIAKVTRSGRDCPLQTATATLDFEVGKSEVEVLIRGAIPYDNISGYLLSPRHVFKGDGPGSFPACTTNSAFFQKVTLDACKASNPSGSVKNPTKGHRETVEYRIEYTECTPAGVCTTTRSLDASGNLTSEALADTVLGPPLMTRKANFGTGLFNDCGSPTFISDRKLKATCIGGGANDVLALSPKTEYEFNITLDYSDLKSPQYQIEGAHDGFPAYQICMEGQTVYSRHPGPASFSALSSMGWPKEINVNESGSVPN